MNRSWQEIYNRVILLLASFLILGSSLSLVMAQPAVESVSVTKNGDHTILALEIRQEPSSFEDELDTVTAVAVRLNGGEPIIQNVAPNPTYVVTVEIDLGVIEGTPNAELSILTTYSDWTPWFEPFEVPEFTQGPIALLFLVLTLPFILRTLRARKSAL